MNKPMKSLWASVIIFSLFSCQTISVKDSSDVHIEDSNKQEINTTVANTGLGILNLVGGLGSFIDKDPAGGIIVLLGELVAASLILYEINEVHRGDEYANWAGNIGIGIAGVVGVFGLTRPFYYSKKSAR